ncbi:hypothetical protein [Devosia rhizoryzae]|uniref:Uncharacterized protein n=1 Tax=Devosia rhizoryzae TaxID=2774137 RepID=A0ABX7C900_9HYPH|nr:hypothetical protein [Devosia rhizoryzae]QQR40217.1 hypothetical protein JI748_04185 [Devosia rhizoryzae]
MKLASLTLALAIASVGTLDAAALDRRVRINNHSSYDIIEFYASNKGTRDWQEDILGRNILPAGNSVVINIDDGTGYCKYDFLAVFEDGDELVKYNNNVCELSDFSYWD